MILSKSPWIKCEPCDEGRYTNNRYESSCTLCPKGWHQNAKGTQYCIPCEPGQLNALVGQPLCQYCPKGQYTSSAKADACKPCEKGKYQDQNGVENCKFCKAGKFSNATGVKLETACINCESGKFSSAPGAKLESACIKCGAGKIGGTNLVGAVSAVAACVDCPKGQYRSGEMTNNTAYDTSCEPCGKGKYQAQEGQAICLPCIPGKYQDVVSQSLCLECPNGKYQPDAKATKCIELEKNNIAPQGSAAAVEVPAGSYLTECLGDTCRSFSSCPQGWKGDDETRKKNCSECPAGQSSFKGSTECRTCAKGKFSNVEKSEICKDCPEGFYQPSDSKAEDALECTKCPTGFAQKNTGSAVCISNGGKTPEDCKDNEYFNASKFYDQNKPLGDCEDCPDGASCDGDIAAKDIIALFGWSRCPAPQQLIFTKCKRPSSCLGAPNVKLEIFNNGVNLASESRNESCAIGHVQNSSLNLRCSQCAPNFAAPSGGSSGTCVSCEKQKGAIVLVALAAIFAVIIFLVLIALKMKSS